MKKRKTDGNKVNNQSLTRAVVPRGFRALSSKYRSDHGSDATVKEGCSKRVVRFADTENDEILDASPIRFQRHQASRSVEPSTTEFACFKKLKEDAGRRIRSQALHREPTSSRPSSPSQNRSADFVLQEKTSNSHEYSMLYEDAPPDNSGTLRTPVPSHRLPEESGFAKTDSGMTRRNIPSPWDFSATLEPYESSGVVRPGELFYRKRQRLRKWVTDSCPEINDASCNRHDTVSMLLNRLFPARDPKLTCGKVKSEPETYSRKFLASPEKNITEFTYGRSSAVDFASCFEIASDRKPPSFNVPTARYYEIRELDCGDAGRSPPSSHGKSIYAPRQIKEWDECSTLLIPWSDQIRDTRRSPPNSRGKSVYAPRQLKEWDECSTLLIPWSDPIRDARRLPPNPRGKSVYAPRQLKEWDECSTLLIPWSDQIRDSRRSPPNPRGESVYTSRQLEEWDGWSTSLSLWGDDQSKRLCFRGSHTPSMRLSEPARSGVISLRDDDQIAVRDNMGLPLENEDHHWHMGKTMNQDHYIEPGSTISGFDLDTGQKCLPWNSFSEPLALEGSPKQLLSGDVFENYDDQTSPPLLLDKSHWMSF
ncbi:hypothetical protein LINPERPRIM_LOCUS19960 [Linum perenne]